MTAMEPTNPKKLHATELVTMRKDQCCVKDGEGRNDGVDTMDSGHAMDSVQTHVKSVMESVQREERIVMENVVPLEVIHTPVLIMMMTTIGIMALGEFD